MPVALLQPGVYIEEIPSGVRTITGVATSITLFVGWAPRGPVDRALRLTSFPDFQRAYGGLDSRSLLGYSVRIFCESPMPPRRGQPIAISATSTSRRVHPAPGPGTIVCG
jgi:phage tail sheath protein FI